MRAFSEYNPIVLLVYFLSVTVVAMFCMNPVILALSFLGSITLFVIHNSRLGIVSHLVIFALFIVMALINPILYHNGVTVLFVVNDNPVTLEALLYGVAASAMIISVIYWFRSFSQLMSSDKLLYLFGSVSPKLALILSMSLRYIPLFGTQTKRVNQTQKALGLYKDDNALDSIRGGTRVFSVMVTWALENGIITADSMSARGYGIGKRTFFSLYRFRKRDAFLLALILLLLVSVIIGIATNALNFTYYPALGRLTLSPMSLISYFSYTALAFLPSVIEVWEDIKWKYLQSKI